MIDYVVVLAGVFAAVSPFGALGTVVALRGEQPDALPLRKLVALSPAAAFIALTVAALVSSPLLDLLDVSGANFEWAAAAMMLPLAARLLITGDSMAVPQKLPAHAWLVPFSLPMLASPTSLAAAVSYADRIGLLETIVASAIALAVTAALFATTAWWEKRRPLVVSMFGRLSGVLLIGMAVEMALDGLRRI